MTTTAAEPTAIQKVQELPEAVARRGIDEPQWRTLMNSLFPGASASSVLMVVDYCKARRLDPMKKPCHIVPMKVKQGDEYVWRDVVLPGIYEYRTTAMRTGLYRGHTAPAYGPVAEFAGVSAPEWCSMTFKRAASNGDLIEFPVTVYFREVCNTKDEWVDKKRTGRVIANDRWSKAPIQMLTKVCEAAGLREAFPDEFGGETTAEEMEGRDTIDVTPAPAVRPAQRLSQSSTAGPAPAGPEPQELIPEPEATATQAAASAPSPAASPLWVGLIVDVLDKSQGDKLAAVVVLNTGFKASTRDGGVIGTANSLKGSDTLVELRTKPSSNPALYAPSIEELIVLPTGEVSQ